MEDLICYSFQVARGMEFLASRKVSSAFPLLLIFCACLIRDLTYSHLSDDTQRDAVICLTLLWKSETAVCTQSWEISSLAFQPLLNHPFLKFLSLASSHFHHSPITAQAYGGMEVMYTRLMREWR